MKTTLPAPGPAWFGAVMGTGILSTLSHTVGVPVLGGLAELVARATLVIGWTLLVWLSVAFGSRVRLQPSVLRASWADTTQAPLWGMVSMGLLAVGGATAAVLPGWSASAASLAWTADAVLWVLGTVLGVVTAVWFSAVLVRSSAGAPTTVWGLAVVPPMVSATVGAGLVAHVESAPARLALLVVLAGCFFLALALGAVVFAVAYHHHWRVAGLAVGASVSAWIPLGIVGQSTAAAQAIASQTAPLLDAESAAAVRRLAELYGYAALAVGVPLVCWAVAMTVRGFRQRMAFVPGWWALTFPVGTLSLGCWGLATATGQPLFQAGAVGCWLVLCGTWTLCASSSLRAVRAGRLQVAPVVATIG